MSDPLVKVLAELRRTQQEHAMAAMDMPHKQKFDHGVEVGIHRGLSKTIEIVEAALRDDLDPP